MYESDIEKTRNQLLLEKADEAWESTKQVFASEEWQSTEDTRISLAQFLAIISELRSGLSYQLEAERRVHRE